MSVSTELETLKTNIGNAYTTIGTKGGTVPANKNTDNLTTAINSIPSGGSYDPTDPQSVYDATRPDDWMVMPTPADNEIYLLYQIPANASGSYYIGHRVQGTSGTIEFGTTDASGNFTAIPDYTLNFSGSSPNDAIGIPVSAFVNTTSEGKKQLMCKIKGAGSITTFYVLEYTQSGSMSTSIVHELRGKATSLANFGFNLGSISYSYQYATNLRYFSLEGTNSITSVRFACPNLLAILSFDTSHITSTNQLFTGCHNLLSIPELDLGSCTSSAGMFNNCSSLEYCKLKNFNSSTSMSGMFGACSSLKTVIGLDGSACTNYSQMFQGCEGLIQLPTIANATSGTNFQRFVENASSMTYIDLSSINFSAATNINLGYIQVGTMIILGDTFGSSGITQSSFINPPLNGKVKVRIDKTDAMMPITSNATAVFGSQNSSSFVYVPDALYSDYQADAKWATLSTRLKKISEW